MANGSNSVDAGQARLDEIEKTYDLCFKNRTSVLAACSADQATTFLEQYADLRSLLTGIVADDLSTNNQSVLTAHAQLIKVNKQIIASLDGLKDVATFINLLTQAVGLATTIVALGA